MATIVEQLIEVARPETLINTLATEDISEEDIDLIILHLNTNMGMTYEDIVKHVTEVVQTTEEAEPC